MVTHNQRSKAPASISENLRRPAARHPALLEQVEAESGKPRRCATNTPSLRPPLSASSMTRGDENKESYTHDVSFYHGIALQADREKRQTLTPDEEKKALADLEKAAKELKSSRLIRRRRNKKSRSRAKAR